MSNSRSARTLLRAAVARVARSLVRRAQQELLARPVCTEALEPRQMLTRAIGLDVSHYNGAVNWSSVASAGYAFAYAKATEGYGVTDADMSTNLTGGANAGVIMGAYHYAKPDTGANDAVNEANWFVGQAGNYIKPGYLRPALDLSENTQNMSVAALSTWVNTFCSTVKSATGVDPIIYTNNDFATNQLNSSVAANHDLWIARWSTAYGEPTTTGSPPVGVWGPVGESWKAWQYTNTGTVSGISGSVDRDVFNGDRTALGQYVITASPTVSLHLDFGPTGSSVPSGYTNVAGDLFGSQSGQQMGWSATGVTTDSRTAGTAPDARYRTYAMPALGGQSRSFEVAVPNGSYTVHVVTGSPDQYPNAQKITVEGVTAVNASTSSTTPFIAGTVTVNVTDGRLTLTSDYNGSANTRLDYVDIASFGAPRIVPTISGSNVVNEGSTYTLNLATATGSATPTGWSVNWGDGTTPDAVAGTATSVTHVFARGPAAYTISATASDATSSYPATNTVAVQVADVAPTLQPFAEVPFVAAGGKMKVPLGTFTDPGFGTGESFTESIDWGDGTTVVPFAAPFANGHAGTATSGALNGTHAYALAGTYPVSITLADAGGQTTTLHTSLVVQPAPTPYLVPGAPGSSTLVSFTVTSDPHSSGFKNELGLFFVDGPDYSIGTLTPGGTTNADYVNYAMAALTDPSSHVAVSRSAPTGTTHSYVLPAGKYVAFYMVQDATTANFVNGTFPTDYSSYDHGLIDPARPNVFFMNPVANFDHFQHVRPSTDSSGAEHFGWEDNVGGGDQDFNDIVFTLTAEGAPELTATATSSTSAALSWNDQSSNDTGFRIERRPAGGTWATIGSVAANATSYTDTTASPQTAYEYRVVALNAAGDAGASNTAAVTTPAAAPTGLTATPDTVGQTIDLAWNALTGADSVIIYRGTSATTLVPYDTALGTINSYGDHAATVGTTFYYSIAANVGGVVGDRSSIVIANLASPASTVHLSGPTLLNVGAAGHYSSTGFANDNLQWSVLENGLTVSSGSGDGFEFTPSGTGIYQVRVTGTSTSGAMQTAALALTVTQLAPKSVISGPDTGFAGRALTFGATGGAGQLTYQWVLLDGEGSTFPHPAGTDDPRRDLSTFVVPGTLSVGSYEVRLTTSIGSGPAATSTLSTFPFSILPAPSADALTWGAIPTEREGGNYNNALATSAVAKQDDGKLLIATNFSQSSNNDFRTRTQIVRLNADLTVDQSFGPNHDGIVNFDAAASFGNPDGDTMTSVYDAKINPINGDLIVTGAGTGSGVDVDNGDNPCPELLVAEFLTSSLVISGQTYQPGSLDPRFNGAKPFLMNGHGSTTSTGYTILVVPASQSHGGDILIGGGEATTSDAAIQDQVNATSLTIEDLEVYPSPPAIGDFLLVDLKADGTLNTAFNGSGVAQEPDFSLLDVPAPFQGDQVDDVLTSYVLCHDTAIANLVLKDGKILAGGTAQRLVDNANAGALTGNRYSIGWVDSGFGLAQYDLDGTLDSSFGTSGSTFTSSSHFGSSGSGIGAELGAMDVESDGSILTAGTAGVGVGAYSGYSSTVTHVVLAHYSTNGVLDTTYGLPGSNTPNGIATTAIESSSRHVPLYYPDGEAGKNGWFLPQHFDLYSTQRDPAVMSFEDHELIASVFRIDPTQYEQAASWDIVRIAANGLLDTTFGDQGRVAVPTSGAASEGTVTPDRNFRSASILTDGDQVIVLGNIVQQNPAPGYWYNYAEPAVLRINSSPPATSDLMASSSVDGGVRLTWQDAGARAEGFVIQRGSSLAALASSPITIGYAGSDQADFLDASATGDTDYFYRIVPFFSAPDGSLTYATPGDATFIHTMPESEAGYSLRETLNLSSQSLTVSTALPLNEGETYVITVSGAINLANGESVDAGFWYQTSDPKTRGDELGGMTYGVGLSLNGTAEPITVPFWAAFDGERHSYSFAYVGRGEALSLQLLAPLLNVAAGSGLLSIQIYGESNQPASPPTGPSLPAGAPALKIAIPAAVNGAVGEVLSASAAVDVLASQADGTPVPWKVTLISPTGSATTIAQGQGSSGTYPDTMADVGQLDPSRFAAGVYTLRLSTTFPTPQQNYSVDQTITLAPPILKITSPVATPTGTPPVLNGNTSIDILAAAPDGTQVPWTLSLISADGTRNVQLAAGTRSAGNLPGDAASVYTLNPTLYENGQYTLRLSTAYTSGQLNLSFDEPVAIETAVKAGNLAFTVSDGTVNTAIGPIDISRSYDSYRLDQKSYFGPGWTLRMLDSQLQITSQNGVRDASDATPVLRAGDLITMTLPGAGQHVFEFDPILLNENTAYGGTLAGQVYEPNFVAVDGSGATLRLVGMHSQGLKAYTDDIAYDALDNEFVALNPKLRGNAGQDGDKVQEGVWGLTDFFPVDTGFNPARPGASSYYDLDGSSGEINQAFDPSTLSDVPPYNLFSPEGVPPLRYQVSLPGGKSYSVDSNTGQIVSMVDQNGNTVDYSVSSSQIKATLESTGRALLTMNLNGAGQITEVDAPGQAPLTYSYDAAGNLKTEMGRSGAHVNYAYGLANAPHLLTGVSNENGQTVLDAEYDPMTDRLAAIVNADGVREPITIEALGSDDVAETVVDAAGNTTQNVYDEKFGNVLRSIRTVTDATTGATSYVVAVSDYDYVTDNVGAMSALRPSGVQVLHSIETYAPFIVAGPDAAGLSLSEHPAAGSWTKQVVFDTSNDSDDVARLQPISTSTRIDDAGALITTLYGHYVLIDGTIAQVKPRVTQIELRTPDSISGSGYDDQVESTTYVDYDAHGNQTYSVVAVARNVPGYPATSPVLAGGFSTAMYVTLTGLSEGNGSQALAWIQATGEYAWADTANGDDVELQLVDLSLAARGANATPVQGDAWSLRIKNVSANGEGVTGAVSGLEFDGTPLGLQRCIAALLDGSHLHNIQTSAAIVGNAGIAIAVPGWIAQGTANDYLVSGYAPAGLVADTKAVTAVIDPDGTVHPPQPAGGPTGQANYYTSVDYSIVNGDWVPNTGAAYGRPRYTVDAAGQETFYAYDLAGRAVLQYVYETWAGADGTPVRGWVGTTTVYDSAGRVTDTYQATYRDGSAAGPQAAGAVILPVIAGGPAGVQVDTSACPVYAAPRRTQHTDYDALGRVADTIDQYGGQTTYTYDVHGNTIRVVNPDGTETRTVYDALNRVIWQTASFVPTAGTGANDDALTTHTLYDALGNAVRTEQYSGTVISIVAATATASARSSLTTAGTLISTSQTFYDPSGQTIETISPTGLRTGTVYTPAGQVFFTGPLNAGAPDGGRSVTVGGVTSLAYLTSDFASDAESDPPQYDGSLGLFYTRSVDRNGHQTKAYTDVGGRTVRTVYDDGSFSETLYSRDGTPVSIDEEGDALTLPYLQIPAGGREEVHVAQRKAGDTPVLTVDLYDAAGRLTDVWLPAVTDADPNSPTYSPTHNDQLVAPHWTYAYDAAGNETAQVSPAEQAAYHQWLNAGAGWTYTQPTYDDETGEQVTPGTWSYASPTGGLTAFGYDANGNQVRQTLPDGEVQTWTYDSRNRLSTHTDFDGNVATYSYQNSGTQAGDLMGVLYVAPSGSGKANQTVGYTYDALGRQQTVVDATGTSTSHYDIAGDLIESDTPEGTIHYVYNLATGEHTETYTDHTDTAYGYDAEGRLDTVTVNELNGSTLATPLVTSYTYYANGDKHTETLPNGVVSTWSYDDLDRLTGLTEANGTTTLFGQSYVLNDDGTRAGSHEVQRQPDGSTVTVDATWTYDADGRLTGEQQVSSTSGESFADTFSYSLDNNRVKSVHVGPGVGANETVTYAYNGDNELTGQVSSTAGTTTFTYDNNGDQLTSTTGGTTVAYGYDARGKLVSAGPTGTTPATYVYDDAGHLVSQTALGVTTTFLADDDNPTGYTQRLESRVAGATGVAETYLLGDRVLGQSDGNGAAFLLVDGHGSTQALTTAIGTVSEVYRYDAFGGAVNFDADSAGTVVLFGGDAVYDPSTGLYDHGDGVRERDGFRFVERDSFPGATQDPQSLHKYAYADASPTMGNDPTGYFIDLLGEAADELGEAAEGAKLVKSINGVKDELEQGIAGYEAIEAGYVNATMAPEGVNSGASFAIGFAGTLFTEEAKFAGVPCPIASGIGTAITDVGNDALQNGADAFSATSIALTLADVAFSALTGCFVAGTDVQRGDGSEQPIDQIQVGERVATDAGVANSADGETAAADPDATAVDPSTWRKVTVDAGDWQVEALEPETWIEAHQLTMHSAIQLSWLVDLQEMGIPADVVGTVDAIDACPAIASGSGRVVLTTVSHASADVYDLTLTDASGESETLGVTGTHPFYDEQLGWVHVADLADGETLRAGAGDVTVTSVARRGDAGGARVYNMSVEGDHVYYVGDLRTLTHNNCDDTVEGHHLQFQQFYGENKEPIANLTADLHRELHELIADEVDQQLHGRGAPSAFNGGAEAWKRFFSKNPGTFDEVDALINEVTHNFFYGK